MSHEFVFKNFPDSVYEHNFEIITSHGTSHHNLVADIPLPTLFKQSGTYQVYLYDFHKEFVGLIGSDFLSLIEANIDYKWNHIQTENTVVPFYYNFSMTKQLQQKRNQCNFLKCKNPETILCKKTIPPRTEMVITLPAIGGNGNKMCPKIQMSEFLIVPSAVVHLHNNWFTTTIMNTSEKEETIYLNNPLYLDEIDISERNFTNQSVTVNNHNVFNNSKSKNKILVENLENNLRLDHLNEGE